MSEKKPHLQNHGRIVTQNSDLLRLLKEKTEEGLRKTTKSSSSWTSVSNNNKIENYNKNDPRASALSNQSRKDNSTSKADNSGDVDPRGSGVFAVVNPAVLRAVGINPTTQQESNFELYSPKVNQDSSLFGSSGNQAGKSNLNYGSAFDLNNNSSRGSGYNNYQAEGFDSQKVYKPSQVQDYRYPVVDDLYRSRETKDEDPVGDQSDRRHTGLFFSPEEVERYQSESIAATPSKSNSDQNQPSSKYNLQQNSPVKTGNQQSHPIAVDRQFNSQNISPNPQVYNQGPWPPQVRPQQQYQYYDDDDQHIAQYSNSDQELYQGERGSRQGINYYNPEHKVVQSNSSEQYLNLHGQNQKVALSNSSKQESNSYGNGPKVLQDDSLEQVSKYYSPDQDLKHSYQPQPKTLPSSQQGYSGKSPAKNNRPVPRKNMSSTEPVKRVYIDSPTFTKEEEEEYRFVSSRLDDAKDDTYRKLEEEELESSNMPVRSDKSKGIRRVHYEDTPQPAEPPEYEDATEESQRDNQPTRNPSQQFVLRSSEQSKSSLNQSDGPTPAPRRLPNKPPGLGHRLPSGPSYDPKDEEELEEETDYQVKLMTRIGENTKRVSDFHIPKLPLPDSDEENVQDSLNFDSQNPPYNPNFAKDSLELYSGYEDEAEAEAPHQAYNVVHPYSMHVSSNNQRHQPQVYHVHSVPTQNPHYHQHQGPPDYTHNQQYNDQVPIEYKTGTEQYPGNETFTRDYVDDRYEDYPSDVGQYGYPDPGMEQLQTQQQFSNQPRRLNMPQGVHHGPSPRYSDTHLAQGEPYPQQVPQAQLRVFPGQQQEPVQGFTYPGQQQESVQGVTYPGQQQELVQGVNYPGQQQELVQGITYPGHQQDQVQRVTYPQQQQDPLQGVKYPGQQLPVAVPRNGAPLQPSRERLNYPHAYAPQEQRNYQSGYPGIDPNQHVGQGGYPQAPVQDPYPRHLQYDPNSQSDWYGEAQVDYDFADQSTKENTPSPQKSSHGNLSPMKARHDFIQKNRKDYGKIQKKSYRTIQATKKEEEAKLGNIFIDPKLKLRKKQNQPNSAPTSNPKSSKHYMSSPQLDTKPSTAEEVWAQKSNNLSAKKSPKKKASLTRYASDSGLPIINQNQRQTNSVSSYKGSPYTNQGYNDVQKPLAVNPITREIFTEDGQKISVDVNLKLLTPPVGSNRAWGYSEQAAWEDYGAPVEAGPPQGLPVGSGQPRRPVGVPYNYNLPNTQSSSLQHPVGYSDYDDYPPPVRDYPSARDYESAPEFLEHSGTNEVNENRPSTNPYPVIPPIGSRDETNDSVPSKLLHETDSYVVQYRRQKEKKSEEPWYKIYNLKDYRKMQKEVQLGTLGPDLDNSTHKERVEKSQRQNDYARMVMERNKKQAAMNRRPPSYPKQPDQEEIINKRKLAVEYAKTVPKPQVKPNKVFYHELTSPTYSASHSTAPSRSVSNRDRSMDVIDLENLCIRHERDKQNVAVIQQNLEMNKA